MREPLDPRESKFSPGPGERGSLDASDTLEQLAEAQGNDGVGELADAIAESFPSSAGFKAQLTKAAATTQGSGRGVLTHEPLSGRLIVEQVYDHQGNAGQGAIPIQVFDAWEHAFYFHYRNQKVDFTDAMWTVISWQDVAKRYAAKEYGDILLLAP